MMIILLIKICIRSKPMEEYWYKFERFICKKYSIKINDIDFPKDIHSRKFSSSNYIQRPFNQILLSLFVVSNAFHDNIWLNIEAKMCQTVYKTQILSWNALKMLDILNKIWLKGLNPCISKDEELNWSKVSKRWSSESLQELRRS